MTEDNANSGTQAQAQTQAQVQAQAEQLWKAPPSISDIQKPIELDSSNGFDQNFIPYEIEYGVVMDQLSKIYKSWQSTIREYIANAESACISVIKDKEKLGAHDYEPLIQITYNPEQCMLQIEDNGIGLSKRMFLEVFRYFGRSRNAFDPTISGMFGLGAKSFVMLVGDKGSMLLHTKNRETGECYKMYARKAGFDVLPFEDRSYGTSFTFIHDPSLNKASVIEAITKYSRYVRVPVYFSTVGNPTTVVRGRANPLPHYATSADGTFCTIQPHGPELVSMNSLEATTEAEIHRHPSEDSYRRDRHLVYTKLSYETEHYDFSGYIYQYDDYKVRDPPSRNTLMLDTLCLRKES